MLCAASLRPCCSRLHVFCLVRVSYHVPSPCAPMEPRASTRDSAVASGRNDVISGSSSDVSRCSRACPCLATAQAARSAACCRCCARSPPRAPGARRHNAPARVVDRKVCAVEWRDFEPGISMACGWSGTVPMLTSKLLEMRMQRMHVYCMEVGGREARRATKGGESTEFVLSVVCPHGRLRWNHLVSHDTCARGHC